MEYRVLGKTGLTVSVLGFGASPLGGVFGAIDEREAVKAVHMAIDLGVNFMDVSPYYGLTAAESVLGKALWGIPRDSYYLAAKVGRYGDADFDFSAERVTASVDESLARLNVEYIDLVQCHDIEFGSLDQIVDETIPALRRVQETVKVRFVGITGLPLKIFPYVVERVEVDTVLSYCHYNLYDTALEDLVPYLKDKQLGIINASPLGMGLLTERSIPAWHPAPEQLRAACTTAVQYCRNKGVDIAQLALQFSLSNPDIATTLVGIASPEQITTDVGWVSQPLDTALLEEVMALLSPVHNTTWPSGRPENNDIHVTI
jgi:L-galactose dehydrogenase